MYCLLIDDDIPTIHVLHDVLDWGKFGVNTVESAHNIHDAKLLFEHGIPDIIICDIEMPKGYGLDMIQWVRDNEHDCAFIFFTCHENFEFASTAISFHADAYVTKPFDQSKMETSIRNALDSLQKRRKEGEYSRYGQSWLKNRNLVEQSFWRDILFKTISPRRDMIQAEISKRELDIADGQQYIFALACVGETELGLEWDDISFQHAFRNVCSEIVFGTTDHPQITSYQADNVIYNGIIMKLDDSTPSMKDKCDELIQLARKLLRCTVTCYMSEPIDITQMAATKTYLEIMDKRNIIYRGKSHNTNTIDYDTSHTYTLDANQINTLIIQRERVQTINLLKNELQKLVAQNRLDLHTMRTIRQDFMQVVYSLLYKNNIQAQRLFSDEAAQQLDREADGNIFNFMKWVTFMTNKTIDCLIDVTESERDVEKIKRFIHENYHQNLNRDNIAEFVHLTPDYLAKRFKSETGLSVTVYLTEYRIKMACEMLLQDNTSISHIAMNTGFDSISYFSTVFKKITGSSPHAYRARHKTRSL